MSFFFFCLFQTFDNRRKSVVFRLLGGTDAGGVDATLFLLGTYVRRFCGNSSSDRKLFVRGAHLLRKSTHGPTRETQTLRVLRNNRTRTTNLYTAVCSAPDDYNNLTGPACKKKTFRCRSRRFISLSTAVAANSGRPVPLPPLLAIRHFG